MKIDKKEEFEKIVNTPETYALATLTCTGKTTDVSNFFKVYVREYKKVLSNNPDLLMMINDGTISFLNKKINEQQSDFKYCLIRYKFNI